MKGRNEFGVKEEAGERDSLESLPLVGVDHSDNDGRGTCPGDLCYPMKLSSGCEALAGGFSGGLASSSNLETSACFVGPRNQSHWDPQASMRDCKSGDRNGPPDSNTSHVKVPALVLEPIMAVPCAMSL